jgi:hypothetical protein
MTPQTAVTTPTGRFTRAEQRALRAFRTRYQQDADPFTNRERAQVAFLRWLYQSGRLTETGNEVPMAQRS